MATDEFQVNYKNARANGDGTMSITVGVNLDDGNSFENYEREFGVSIDRDEAEVDWETRAMGNGDPFHTVTGTPAQLMSLGEPDSYPQHEIPETAFRATPSENAEYHPDGTVSVTRGLAVDSDEIAELAGHWGVEISPDSGRDLNGWPQYRVRGTRGQLVRMVDPDRWGGA